MRIDSPTYRSLDLFLRGVTAGRCEYCGQGIRHGDGWVQRTGLDAPAEAWNKVNDSQDLAAPETFAAHYNETFYADMARARFESLRK